VLTGLPSVVVEERHHSLQAALDGAIARAERAVRQTTQRRSMKPRTTLSTVPSRLYRTGLICTAAAFMMVICGYH
jgi:ribosome-associated translation inhibitor RaiA